MCGREKKKKKDFFQDTWIFNKYFFYFLSNETYFTVIHHNPNGNTLIDCKWKTIMEITRLYDHETNEFI